jgi:hypothetical protein
VPTSFPQPDQVRAAADRLGVDPEQYAAHLKLLSHDEAAEEVARALQRGTKLVDQDVVYGEWSESLVFIPERRAEDLAEVVDAWRSSSTWGEFRHRVEARGIAEEFLYPFEYPEGFPGDNEPLSDDQKDEYTADGDWPAWPAAEMLDWVPQDIAGMGESGVSMVSGAALSFDPEQERALVAAFEQHGFRCRRDDDLVAATHALR